jgi:formate dehydrogenase assembly factor FdhD
MRAHSFKLDAPNQRLIPTGCSVAAPAAAFHYLVQKAVMIGAPVRLAVSAPTARPLRVGDVAGTTLIGIARGDEFELLTHPSRMILETVQHVARGRAAPTRSG